MLRPEDFFNITNFSHRAIFEDVEYVWDVLKRINEYVKTNVVPVNSGRIMEGAYVDTAGVQLGKGSVIEPGAYVKGPCIIGENSQIRNCAYIRGDVIVGNNCVVGHATEIKNSIMLDDCDAPHFNYVGDSILGNGVNLGAGTKVSNLKITEDLITVRIDGKDYETGLRKFGAIIGDNVQTGCNSVLNPGTLLGPRSLVYPNATISGYFPAESILKLRQQFETVKRT